MSKCVRAYFALSVVAILFPAVLYGQTTTAQISGTVRDSSGGIVSGAEITIRNTGTGISRTLQSDGQGRYVAPDLSIGSASGPITRNREVPQIQVREPKPISP